MKVNLFESTIGREEIAAAEGVGVKKMHPWIGVDLDGTLAHYNGWKGYHHIGKPVPLMVRRVKEWLRTGWEVRILTARACEPEGILPVHAWVKRHLGVFLTVTANKDLGLVAILDDRAIQVRRNTGRLVGRMKMSKPCGTVKP